MFNIADLATRCSMRRVIVWPNTTFVRSVNHPHDLPFGLAVLHGERNGHQDSPTMGHLPTHTVNRAECSVMVTPFPYTSPNGQTNCGVD